MACSSCNSHLCFLHLLSAMLSPVRCTCACSHMVFVLPAKITVMSDVCLGALHRRLCKHMSIVLHCRVCCVGMVCHSGNVDLQSIEALVQLCDHQHDALSASVLGYCAGVWVVWCF